VLRSAYPASMSRRSLVVLTAWLAIACGAEPSVVTTKSPAALAVDTESLVTITVLGTNDVHGAVNRLPVLAGFVEILRRQRAAQGGGVVLVDAGDMFQGTLESNLGEGKAIVELMNAIGYDAACVGNHEFDFGPVGAAATPKKAGDDPRGALRARAKEAHFPFLGANIFDRDSGQRVDWDNMPATRVLEVAGVKVGIIGLSTVETPQTTIAANVVGLEFRNLAETVKNEAGRLRNSGVSVIVVNAHAGGKCQDFSNPQDLSSCAPGQEIFELAQALPSGLVDVIVAGHTHRGVAHVVNGIPIIEQYAHGRYFGRVDLAVAPRAGRVVDTRIHNPHSICLDPEADVCEPPESYEGEAVRVPEEEAAIAARWADKARALREAPLGIVADTAIPRSRELESVMGNWVADLMLAARPTADIAITNGGGLRAEIDAGPITYGELYRVLPFDNRFAIAELTGAELERAVAANLAHDGGILSFAGLTVEASCASDRLDVVLRRTNGKVIGDDERLHVVTSDFLATTATEFAGKGKIVIEDEPTIRDAVAEVLRARGGSVSAADKHLFDASNPRFKFAGARPVTCSAPN